MPNRITLVAHTHWDREWYEPFEVFRAHLVEVLDDALAQLERDERLSFTLDGHVALVDDYLEVRPWAEERIRALVRAGRLHIGPWLTQADTLLTDGESLIRNLAAGLRRADELGGAMRLGYMPDQFGHAAQVPQILRACGIDGAILWRGVGPERPPHAFRWESPDGSAVTTVWLPDGYGSGRRLPSDPGAFADTIELWLARMREWLGDLPVLIPIGDDHTRLAKWLPEAANVLRLRLPGVTVAVGGYHEHLPHVEGVTHSIAGELRSPAFAPVLAGVASARVREKQAAARAATLLLKYAEPIAAWERITGSSSAHDLLERAWRQLLLNHAHDSAAGCGIDAAHEDVKARYRWAEQLARAAIDRSLSRIQVAPRGPVSITAFHAGPAAPLATIEAHVPRSLSGTLVSVGPDGVSRAVQFLDAADEAPLFEGEFSPAELSQYLGGLDPQTPLFGKFLTGIAVHEESGGLFRLDVGLGDTPAAPAALAADQERVALLVPKAARFKVVLHPAAPTRPVLVQAGPAPAAGFMSIEIRPGSSSAPRAQRLANGLGIVAGPLSVIAAPDGEVFIRDETIDLPPVRANHLVDEGDRGDLYHFDPVGPSVRGGPARIQVEEDGPVRARLRIQQELDLPVALDGQRRARMTTLHRARVVTDVILHAGERRVDFVTQLDNGACDHRLRAHVHAPIRCERLEVEHGLAVVRRPIAPEALGHGSERAAPTGQHHAFVDVCDGKHGLALFSRGLVEHELAPEGDGSDLALTLLRSVGWLSRGDLSVISHAAGPVVPTPGAQELGPHRFEYALVLHAGDWHSAGILDEARRYEAPPLAVRASGASKIPGDRSLVEVAPRDVRVTAIYPTQKGIVVRVCNAAPHPTDATIRPTWPFEIGEAIDPLERAIGEPLTRDGGVIRQRLRPWQIFSLLVR